MKANSPLSIYLCLITSKLNTEHDVEHVASQCVGLQGEGVPGLQLLVDRAPTMRAHMAPAVTAVVGVVIRLF